MNKTKHDINENQVKIIIWIWCVLCLLFSSSIFGKQSSTCIHVHVYLSWLLETEFKVSWRNVQHLEKSFIYLFIKLFLHKFSHLSISSKQKKTITTTKKQWIFCLNKPNYWIYSICLVIDKVNMKDFTLKVSCRMFIII